MYCRMKSRCQILVNWLLVGLILLMAGCTQTPPVVKLGLIAPFEELYRSDGYATLYAVQLAIEQRNMAGGIGGRQVALVALNDDGQATEAARQAASLGVDDAVLAVIGPIQRAAALGAGEALAEQHLPWVSLASLSSEELAGGFALEAAPEQLRSLAAARSAVPVVIASQPFSVTTVTEVLWLGDAASGAANLLTLPAGMTFVGGPEVGSLVFTGRAGDAAEGVRWLSAGPELAALPASFVAAYQRLAGREPSPQAVLAYDAANLVLDALERATKDGSRRLSRPQVAQALAELGQQGWQGLSGPVQWQADACPTTQPCGVRRDPPIVVHHW